jgi:prepilin-type processing-associated H-X9-DG protein
MGVEPWKLNFYTLDGMFTYTYNRNLGLQGKNNKKLIMIKPQVGIVIDGLYKNNTQIYYAYTYPYITYLLKRHDGGENVLFADGHAKWFPSSYVGDYYGFCYTRWLLN